MFKKLLIANRGEIAVRIIRTARRMGVGVVAVYSEADLNAPHVQQADDAVCLGPAPAKLSYLRQAAIVKAALATGAEAIHPGYGFLSENADFAQACVDAGLSFIGPTPQQIRRFGLKHEARAVAAHENVPMLPGTPLLASLHEACQAAMVIGYPVMLKSTAGGGGIGLRVCHAESELTAGFEAVGRLAQQSFESAGVFVEKYLPNARHVEVQIFGDGRGRVLALGERDCSAQRRNQKVVEESPAPGLLESTRGDLAHCAQRLTQSINYANAGTVEFVLDRETQQFFFLEVNTRLQVEHGVTEAVTGVDLVEWMIRQAAGDFTLPLQAPRANGCAMEVRLYAEDPAKAFQPSAGTVTHLRWPSGVRCDTWIEEGTEITAHYDPLLAKLIVHGETRDVARIGMHSALLATRIAGVQTNLQYLREIVDDAAFAEGGIGTRFLDQLIFAPGKIDVVDGGAQTTIQDYPGRAGYWAVGVPPSGPMDDLSFRLANRIVGNPEGVPGLEIVIRGPKLCFTEATVVAIAGAEVAVFVDGQPAKLWEPITVSAGGTVSIGTIKGPGARAYLAVRGGLDVPHYLGSASTFMLGHFGGLTGHPLQTGDVLTILTAATPVADDEERFALHSVQDLPQALRPHFANTWEIGVLYGPHGAPDFFTDDDIDQFFTAHWQVHYNSDRTGIRLIGPKPTWARRDGGEAGLHPSNLHDNAYAVGAIDYTGDMPVILGPDGPSLGGFVCPATVVKAELWKLGQLLAGDRVRFVRLSEFDSRVRDKAQQTLVDKFKMTTTTAVAAPVRHQDDSPILLSILGTDDRQGVVFRRDGDSYLLVEYGDMALDFGLRLRAHSFAEALAARDLPGIIDITPGIRSVQVHFDSTTWPIRGLVDMLREIEVNLVPSHELKVPSRIVSLPLSWEDPATLLAIERYTRSVRADAPWCPSNIEFIRRINGLQSVDDVRRIVFDASYLVLGLGDVYLGAPVATPVDPRHRLVTTKYNPARTWTAENSVGIGGAYMCIYGMEGPGGYQFVGRTVQVWNTYRATKSFRDGRPWLLRFFDQIRFFPVDAKELLEIRQAFPHGRYDVKIEETSFDFGAYRRFAQDNASGITAFKQHQQAAFEAERDRWSAAGQDVVAPSFPEVAGPLHEETVPDGCEVLRCPVAGNLWKVNVAQGAHVAPGDTVMVVESMKMEIGVPAGIQGRVVRVLAEPGRPVSPGQALMWIEMGLLPQRPKSQDGALPLQLGGDNSSTL